MAGIASVGSVGAGLSEAQFQVQYQIRVLKEQQEVAEGVGAAALALIQAVFADSRAQMHDLDVVA